MGCAPSSAPEQQGAGATKQRRKVASPLSDYFLESYLEGQPYQDRGKTYDLHAHPELYALLQHVPSGIQVWGEAIDFRPAAPDSTPQVLYYYTDSSGFDFATDINRTEVDVYRSLEEDGLFGRGVRLVSKEPAAFLSREAALLNLLWPCTVPSLGNKSHSAAASDFRSARPGGATNSAKQASNNKSQKPSLSEDQRHLDIAAGPEHPNNRMARRALVTEDNKRKVDCCIPILVPQCYVFDIWERLTPELQATGTPVGCNRHGERQWPQLDVCMLQIPSKCWEVLRSGPHQGRIRVGGQRMTHLERSVGKLNPDTLAAISHQAELLVAAGKYEEGETVYRLAMVRCEEAYGKNHLDTLTCVNNLAVLLYTMGKLQTALPLQQWAVEGRKDVLGPNHTNTLQSLNNWALLLQALGRHSEAEPLFRQVLEGREKIHGAKHMDTLQSVNNLATLLQAEGKHDEAQPLCRRAYNDSEELLGSTHPDTVVALNNLALLLKSIGQPEEAEQLYREALQNSEATVGPDHACTLAILNNLAVLLKSTGELKQAEPLSTKALEISEATLGPEHPETLTSLNNLAVLLYTMGRYDEAEPLLKRAVIGRDHALGPSHPDTLTSLNNLAAVLQKLEKHNQAESFFRRALSGRQTALGPEHLDTLTSISNHGLLLQAMGRLTEAEPLLEQALRGKEAVLGKAHQTTLAASNHLANLLKAMERFEEAEPYARHSMEGAKEALGPHHTDSVTYRNNYMEIKQVIDLSADLERQEQMQKPLSALCAQPRQTAGGARLGIDGDNEDSSPSAPLTPRDGLQVTLQAVHSKAARLQENAVNLMKDLQGTSSGFMCCVQPGRDRVASNMESPRASSCAAGGQSSPGSVRNSVAAGFMMRSEVIQEVE